jgi:hypothetical protein
MFRKFFIKRLDGWIVNFNSQDACKLQMNGTIRYTSASLKDELELSFEELPGILQEALKQIYPEKNFLKSSV